MMSKGDMLALPVAWLVVGAAVRIAVHGPVEFSAFPRLRTSEPTTAMIDQRPTKRDKQHVGARSR